MKRYFKLLLLFVAFTLLIRCSSNNSKGNAEENSGALKLDDITLSDLTGKEIDMTEFKDKTVFINFWATWCKPCIQEMPTIAKAQEIIKDENVIFLFASSEGVDQIRKFKNKRSFPFRYVQLLNMEELNIQAIPATLIFNSEGKLIFSEVGYRNWDTPENIALITNKPSTP